MFTAAFSIPFCITALVDGGPATLTTLALVSAAAQLIISKWLFILRRIVTPTVGGTVMMILSITLASVVFGLLDKASIAEPVAAPLTALATLGISSRWGPARVGLAASLGAGNRHRRRLPGCRRTRNLQRRPGAASPLGGTAQRRPGLGLDFGIPSWTLLPAFLFLGVIISIEADGEAIAFQRVAWRDDRAVDFRQVQRTLSGAGVSNLLAGLAGAVPNIINPGIVSFTQLTGVAARRVGYCIGCAFILVAFLPKVSGLLSTISGPVMTGYLILVTGTLFVDGARILIQNEQNRQKIVVAGICFWIGAAFQFELFTLPNLGAVVGALLKSGITTGGFAAIVMILYLELTNPRRMRFQSRLHIDALPELNEFIARLANRCGWDAAMQERLSAFAEETLLTLAPLNLEGDLEEEDAEQIGRLVVLASSEGPIADLEFIGGGNEENIEDQVRQLQQHAPESPVENEISLRLLRSFALSVRHQQYQGTDIIAVRVAPP